MCKITAIRWRNVLKFRKLFRDLRGGPPMYQTPRARTRTGLHKNRVRRAPAKSVSSSVPACRTTRQSTRRSVAFGRRRAYGRGLGGVPSPRRTRDLHTRAPAERLSDYAGHLIIDWGRGFRSWVQRADRQDKPVLEIRKEVREQPFPGLPSSVGT